MQPGCKGSVQIENFFRILLVTLVAILLLI